MSPTNGTLETDTRDVRILILGDVNLDTLIVPLPQDRHPSEDRRMTWQTEGTCWLHRRRGGAWLLAELINAALSSTSFVEKLGKHVAETYDQKANGIDDKAIESSHPTDYLNSSAILGLFPYSAESDHDN
jgi:hypothetical protein